MDPNKPPRRVTIYDVATALGTSPSAVSAVLNGTWRKRRISQGLADRIEAAAAAAGYAVNLQAAGLRRERSRIVGMILPKYDNRYFGEIAERFEAMARARELFPIITCALRDPELEARAAKTMVSHQVDWLVATGATDPDAIAALCAAAGVPTFNLDLPGRRAPSVISDNFAGALDVARQVLDACELEFGVAEPMLFIGGRAGDHNTRERLRGFHAAHAERGLRVPAELVHTAGYAAEKAEHALNRLASRRRTLPTGFFVNSTISLEGVVRWLRGRGEAELPVRLGCFDFDPFAELLPEAVAMVRQDVDALLATLFRLIDERTTAPAADVDPAPVVLVPPLGSARLGSRRGLPPRDATSAAG
ncbi:MAG: substrate-binding domain-containing protein [Gluconacetobacter diazotrophicus]|nr:substrate-binding domain-containing protein [Gluconacetobacter diazotrophicus]